MPLVHWSERSPASLFVLIALAGCSSDGSGPNGDSVTVQLRAAQTSLVPAETTQLTWEVRDASGNVLTGETVMLSSGNTSVATVTPAGVVTAVGVGTATITGEARSVTGQVTILVEAGGLVTAAGGTLTGPGGGMTLIVPAGALSATTAIRLQVASNPLLDPTAVAGSIYSIVPSNLAFAAPATVRVGYDPARRPAGMLESALRVRGFVGGAWSELAGGSVSPASHTAEAPIDGGGTVSVGWVSPSTPCTQPEHRQFDFWLGSWDVGTTGPPFAVSDITATPEGCAILEHWQPNSAPVGRSISFYEPSTDMWYQTYLDSSGQRLTIAGRFEAGVMTMLNPPGGGTTHERWQWYVDGTGVRQTAAPTTNGGVSYQPFSWNALYTPR
ncbi:MAG: Ig-like domain-containing protein [Gemmatimonadales bacterium]